jgi:phosphate transport system permease protein
METSSPDHKPVGIDTNFDRLNRAWYIDKIVQVLVFIGGVSAVIFIIGIFVFISKEGFGFLVGEFSFKEFFLSPNWRPTSQTKETFGILALIAGTASVTGLAMLIAIPFSLGTAIYIAEFSSGKTREFLKITVELLAAIPSVVWGFIGLAIMNPIIIKTFHVPVGLNVLNAGVILGLMAAPIMTSIAEDALKAVPDRYREAAEAMGATRWQVIWKVVLPAAKNGLLGETAAGSPHYQALFTIGIFLFVITFIINLVADLVVRGVRKG